MPILVNCLKSTPSLVLTARVSQSACRLSCAARAAIALPSVLHNEAAAGLGYAAQSVRAVIPISADSGNTAAHMSYGVTKNRSAFHGEYAAMSLIIWSFALMDTRIGLSGLLLGWLSRYSFSASGLLMVLPPPEHAATEKAIPPQGRYS
jgi:hypothetical protein